MMRYWKIPILCLLILSISSAAWTMAQSEVDPFAEPIEDDPFGKWANDEDEKIVETKQETVVGNPEQLSVATVRIVSQIKTTSRPTIAFSRDGEKVAIADFHGINVYQWPRENKSPEVLATESSPGVLRQLEFVGNNHLVYNRFRDLQFVSCDRQKASKLKNLSLPDQPKLVRSSLDGNVAAVLVGATPYLCNMPEAELGESLIDQVYSEPVVDMFLTKAGRQLLVLHKQKVALIDVPSKTAIQTLDLPFETANRISTDGRYVLGSISNNQTIRFELTTGEQTVLPTALAYSPDYRWAISIKDDHRGQPRLIFTPIDPDRDQEVQVPFTARAASALELTHHPTENKFILHSPFVETMFVEYP